MKGGSKMRFRTQVERLALESRRYRPSSEKRRNKVKIGLRLISLVIAGSGECWSVSQAGAHH